MQWIDVTKQACQVAIIGGGSAGISCALALRNLGIANVTVVESSLYDQFRIGESIPPEIKPLFIELGIWNQFLKLQQRPCYGSRSWWGDKRQGYNDSLLNPRGHGWHLDRVRFNRFLAEQAINKGITVLTDCQFENIQIDNENTDDDRHRLHLTHQSKPLILNAQFVVDATGSKGCFAKSKGSEKQFSEPLVCSARRFQINNNDDADSYPLSGLTHLEAVESGWWYAARLPSQQVLISHTTDNKIFRALQLKHAAHWERHLKAAPNTTCLLQNLQPIDRHPRVYSAHSFVLDQIIGNRWLAVGDSASSFDPITSQGILKSISDGIQSAQCVLHTLLKGDNRALDHYQEQIKMRHQQYRQTRSHFYGLESRFDGAAFWAKMLNQSHKAGTKH